MGGNRRGRFPPEMHANNLALWIIPRRTIVEQYGALDVSLQKVLNFSGRALINADVPSEPVAISLGYFQRWQSKPVTNPTPYKRVRGQS
jgi:hypothetical protein